MSVPCTRTRRVEGVLAAAAPPFLGRCGTTTLEYRIADDQPWRSVPLPPGDAAAFLQLP